jgi:hypothetical protein
MAENHPTAEELHRMREDPSAWDDEPTPIRVGERKTEVVSFRLPSEELDQLEEAAAAVGESLSQYVRRALRARMGRSVPAPPGIGVMAGTGNSVWVLTPASGGSAHTDGPEQVPGFPPLGAAQM